MPIVFYLAMMKQVCFLLPDAVIKPGSLFGAIEIFEIANEYYSSKGKPSWYDIRIIDINASHAGLISGYNGLRTTRHYRRAKPDMIIIPGLFEDKNYSVKENASVIQWLRRRYNSGTELASLCTGAFFLAATGLLHGKECSTHWKSVDSLMNLYPGVKPGSEKIITDNKGIYTAGGATSSLNLILYLVEKYNGRQVALYCAKILEIDIDRTSQSQFILFEGLKDHNDEPIKKAQNFIEQNVREKFTVEMLAVKFGMSKRSFIRRFKVATNNVPIGYIQKVKIEAAKRSLESKTRNINEIMYSVGYTDIKAFRNIFKKVTGLTPSEYKSKFGRPSTTTRSVSAGASTII